jgi:hypothetical protein
MRRGVVIVGLLLLTLSGGTPGAAKAMTPVEEADRRELVIDGGFHGPLPPPIIDHGGLVWDEVAGVVRGAEQPIFDLARACGQAGPWRRISEPISLASVVMPGWSRDQTSPRLAMFDRQRMELVIWNGGDLALPPTLRVPMSRNWNGELTPDALLGTPWEKEDVTHRIVSGVMLPGLALMLMERREWTLLPEGPSAENAGLTVAAIQEQVSGTWEWVLAMDVPIDAPPEARDHPRGYISSMASYYPTSRDADFRTAFVPFVDYLNHLPDRKAPGGQCGLIRLDRAAVGDAWQIGPVAEIVSSWGTVGEHYHAAGWTPAGVVLAIGDSIHNRVALLRCQDWDRYDDPTQWTVVPRWQGDAPDGTRVPVNQFWACCCGNDLDTLLVGGDNVSAAVYSVVVPQNGDDTPPRFTALFGDQPAALLDGSIGTTTSWVHRDRPESMGPVVARYAFDGGYPHFSRTLFSPDGEKFATVARLPQGFDRIAIPFLLGGRLHLHRQNSVGPAGILRCTPPENLDAAQGLLVRPGGLDLLRDESGRHREADALVAGPGITVTRIDPGDLPPSTGWTPGPDAICYHVTGRPTTGAGTLVRFDLIDPRPPDFDPGSASVGVHMKVLNRLSSKFLLETEIERGSGTSSKAFHIASTGDWNDCDAWSYISGLRADCTVSLFNRTSGEPSPVDFLLVLRSATLGAGPPNWMLDPIADLQIPGDRVDFPLEIRSSDWSVDIELQVPPEGADFSVGSRMPVLSLCTWMFPGGHHVTLRHRLSGGEFRIETTFSSIEVPDIEPYHFVRGDTLTARLSCRGGVMRLMVRSAGSIGETPDEIVIPVTAPSAPTKLRIGGPAHELHSALIVKRLVVKTPRESSFQALPPRQDPTSTIAARRGYERAEGSSTFNRRMPMVAVDIFEILRNMGRTGPMLSRNLDLDGDGCVSVLDLAAAIRIRSAFAPAGSDDQSESTTRTSPVTTPTTSERCCPSSCSE